MKTLFKYLSIWILTSLVLLADDYSFIDETHDSISQKVILTSTYIDGTIHNWIDDKNQTIQIKNNTNKIDSFYKNEKFIDETDESFLRLRFSSKYQSLEKTTSDLTLRAYISLSKTKKNIKLFIEGVNQNNLKDVPFSQTNTEDSTMAIGISYLYPSHYGIDSKYSLAIRGIYPYVKARYKKTFVYGNWSIEASQSFIYSSKTNFKEETNLYFDKKLNKYELFRILLSRDTLLQETGMGYGLALEYFYIPKKNTAISISQSFTGNTDYKYIENTTTKTYKSINTYSTDISWRQNIWKKWFFYEIKPGIDFQKKNNFKINYKFLFLTDFYFGHNG